MTLKEKLQEVRSLIPLTQELLMKASELVASPIVPTGRVIRSLELELKGNHKNLKISQFIKKKQEYTQDFANYQYRFYLPVSRSVKSSSEKSQSFLYGATSSAFFRQ